MAFVTAINGSKPYIVEDRPMMSRSSGDRVRVSHSIEPGKEETGCMTCFYSPPEYPILAKLPCFDYPEYVVNEMKASQYIYIRENSIEWNQPVPHPAKATSLSATLLCCGHSPTDLTVHDHVRVIYFDDPLMDTVRDDTRCCNPFLSFCCGGRGEEVRLESRTCANLCYRTRSDRHCGGTCCCFCVPVGCPDLLCPCAAMETIYVEDANTAVKAIAKARDMAKIRLQVMDR